MLPVDCRLIDVTCDTNFQKPVNHKMILSDNRCFLTKKKR